jgi:TatD DNase family protein
MYIDTHAHLFDEVFKHDLPDVVARARDAGIETIVVPATTLETSREAIELAERFDLVYACVGIHPHEARTSSERQLEEIERLSHHRKVVAIGEIGLDFHYDFAPRDVQVNVFRIQTSVAIQRNLPIVVHTRESMAAALSIVEEMVVEHPTWRQRNSLAERVSISGRGVFHCFTGTADDAARLFGAGFFVSYPGIVTFRKSPVAETLGDIGYQNILIETDSPYMAPEPMRGRRNEPANIVHIGKKVAELFDISEQELADVTSTNARRLFAIDGTSSDSSREGKLRA